MAGPSNAAELRVAITADNGGDEVVGQLSKVIAATETLDRSSGGLADRFASATLRITELGAHMSETGTAGGLTLNRLIGLAGEMAFGFGAAGPIVGALGIAAVAITKLFRTARDEMDQTQQKIKETAEQALNAGNYAEIRKQIIEVAYGTPSKGGEDGLSALQQKRAEAEQQLADIQAKIPNNLSFQSAAAYQAAKGDIDRLQGVINDLDAKIEPLRQTYDRLVQLLQTPQTAPHDDPIHGMTVTATDAKKALEELQKAQAKEVDDLAALEKLAKLTGPDLIAINTLEATIRQELDKGNLTRARRLELEQELQKITQTRLGEFGGVKVGGEIEQLTASQHAPQVPVQVAPRLDSAGLSKFTFDLEKAIEKLRETVTQQFAEFGADVSTSLVESLATSMGHGFQNAGPEILKGLGTIFSKMGESLISFGAAMIGLLPALSNPFTSGPAALVAGALLLALGTALGGIATGSGSGSSGFGFNAAAATPQPIIVLSSGQSVGVAQGFAPATPVNFTVIGPNDPAAQNAIMTMIGKAQRRGG